MHYVYVNSLQPGMIAADDLYNKDGDLICKTGSMLGMSQIRQLKASYVLNIPVAGGLDYNSHLDMLCKMSNREERFNILNKRVYTQVEELLASDRVAAIMYKGLMNHHPETAMHSMNVAAVNGEIAYQLELPDRILKDLIMAGILHDVGKLAIPTDILSKNARLDKVEFDIMKTHPITGCDILKHDKLLSKDLLTGILEHHERMDGKGYPNNLNGENLHLYSRILAISDSYEALTSKRSYKEPYESLEALRIMREDIGHYDLELINKFEEYILK